jgi:hypothetical protein
MKLIKEIKSKCGKLHFRRWELLKTKKFSIWIHGIYAPDNDLHLHNHPWDYMSLVLWGSFLEEDEDSCCNKRGRFSFSKKKSYKFHKISHLFSSKVYTLFISYNRDGDNWGYLVDGYFINHKEYRDMKNNGDFYKGRGC